MLTSMRLTAATSILFTVLVSVAAVWDVKHRRIPNELVIATALLGIALALVSQGVSGGVWAALGGVGVGLAVWLPCWWLGIMGAGDVKFFAAAAAWLGPRGALSAALITALVGGVLGIGWVVAGRFARGNAGGAQTVAAAEPPATATLPYGVAMALGLCVAAWIPLFR